MKRRIAMIGLAVITAMSLCACSGKKGEAKSVGGDESPEDIFNGAVEKFDKESVKAVQMQTVYSYSDGTEETEMYTSIYDTKKNIVERISKDEDEEKTIYHTFNVKEKDGYGVYVNDELTDNEWKYYTEEVEDGEDSEYEYQVSEFDLPYTEEKGYSNISYSNEGEEELNGEETVKIKVAADQLYDSGVESAEETTRESVLKEYEWSEDEVSMVDGFSEILDNYVTATKESEGETTVKCVLTVWISKDSHTILKSRSAMDVSSAQSDESKKAIEAFNEESWKVDMIHQDMEDGMTKEEAKKDLEEELEAMENPDTEASSEEASGEEYDEEEGTDEYAEITKVSVTKKYLTGEELPEMSALPEDYEKISQDEYFYGDFDVSLEEDDYFTDESEYEDEFEE